MTTVLDADVRRIAQHYGVDPLLIQAVVRAEGDIVKAVQCSVPSVATREQALEVTCRSAAHAMSDYLRANSADAFVRFWAHRWAPIGAGNDPTSLNANWPHNVLTLWVGKP